MLRHWGWEVHEAEDGEQGMEQALLHRPDVILCDLLMPRVNGFQVCRAVRNTLELRHTRVIVLTGRDYAADRHAAADAGADEYLVKPLEFVRLQESLDRIVTHHKTTPPPPEGNGEPNGDMIPAGVHIRFWGVRGSIPTPGPSTVFFGGNTSCVEVRADNEIIILDAGSGIRPLGTSLTEEFKEQPLSITILISHTHWDHIQGFPFFMPAYNPANRVHILGYEGARAGLATTLAGQMESPYFPIALKEMPGNIVIEEQRDLAFQIGSLRVEACFVNHPGVCVGYKLCTSQGDVVYVPDNEWSMDDATLLTGPSVPCTLEQGLAQFIHGAEVLIIDAQYTREEYKKHMGWGHGCVDDVVRLAIAAKIRRLYLFHHDPAHDDRAISTMLMHARKLAADAGSDLLIEAAREGERVILRGRVPA